MEQRTSRSRNCPSGRMAAGYRRLVASERRIWGDKGEYETGMETDGRSQTAMQCYKIQYRITVPRSRLSSLDTLVSSAVPLWLHKRLPA